MSEDKITASCAWGDGPDVIVTLNDHRFILYEDAVGHSKYIHGFVEKGSFDLTAEEAFKLAEKLMNAGIAAQQMDKDLDEYVNKEMKGFEYGIKNSTNG